MTTKSDPFLSIITPVYNDSAGIKITLESLLKQDYPQDHYEIIVVDNNSTDNTRDVVEDFVKKYPKRVKLLVEKDVRRSYAARNKGISASRGEIIAFIDADMWADEEWLSTLSRAFKDQDVGYVGCKIRIHTSKGTLVGLYNKFIGFPVRAYFEESHYVPTACLAVRKDILKKVGGPFDPRLSSSGDREFGDRVWRSGIKQTLIRGFMVHHPARESFKPLLKKNFRIGRGKRQLVEFYPDRFENLKRTLKNFRTLLPYNAPKMFRKQIRENQALSRKLTLKENVFFYLLSIFEITVRNLGYFHEYSKQIKKRFNKGKMIAGIFRNFPRLILIYSGVITNKGPLIGVFWNGTKLRMDNAILSTKKWFLGTLHGIWKQDVYQLGEIGVPSSAVIIDIGAHIGIFSLFAAGKIPTATIYSFEPDPRNFESLRQNILLNDLGSRIHPFQIAVSRTNGVQDLFRSKVSSTSHSLFEGKFLINKFFAPHKMDAKPTKVKALTLKEIFAKNKIGYCDFLKLDCEGAEYEILLAAPPTVLHKIGRISLEYHDRATEYSHVDLVEFLEKSGFDIEVKSSTWNPNRGYLYARNLKGRGIDYIRSQKE